MICRCGGTLKPRARRGRRIPFKAVPALAVPADLRLLTCQRCGKAWADPADASTWRVLDREYAQVLRRLAPGVVDRATEGTGQAATERALGLSKGYLSRVRAEDGTPSTILLALLHLLGLHPELRADIERLWATAPQLREEGDDVEPPVCHPS